MAGVKRKKTSHVFPVLNAKVQIMQNWDRARRGFSNKGCQEKGYLQFIQSKDWFMANWVIFKVCEGLKGVINYATERKMIMFPYTQNTVYV